ncbi:NAD-dependent dehydratase [Nocardioides seonyuensis]|uniref:NAD-dependent dehydratase n=1 Tax=Nocardioides seonyuensis TaxID=2518371 RepID=A0A4P7IL33_9ACTN|nr:NAD(P)H-binding protein [Nocardioides seonyuensis]QBX57197.1 NAD-dependent dehydratase [Nocardioides seonyuensis]
MRVTIFGGHGHVALLLAPLLVEAGHDVQSVIRNPDHVDDVAATGATPVVSSVESAGTPELTSLLEVQDAVVWSAGAGGGDPTRTMAVDRDGAIRSMEAAEAAGVLRYVMVSFSGAFPEFLVGADDPFRPYMDAKIAADEHLRASGLDWTILAPGPLTFDPGHGTVNPSAARGEGDTAPRELVAQVAAAVIDDARASRRTLVVGEGDVPIDEWLGSMG